MVGLRSLPPLYIRNSAGNTGKTSDTGSSTKSGQPRYCTTITHTKFTSASGMNTFHANAINWSKRNRGIVQRTNIDSRMKKNIFMANASTLSTTYESGPTIPQTYQPPRNSAVIRKLVVIMCAYSPRKNSANFIELYSV